MIDINSIDFKKYKRFFTFGCSFTSFIWPTWADIVSKEMPNAEFYNFGLQGSGNLLISLRLAEAHSKFNFCETDLIAIMWSSYTREDRWVKNSWVSLGNIYSGRIDKQSFYPPGWVKRCADPMGYLIRDLGLIKLSRNFLKAINCDYIELFASDTNYLETEESLLIPIHDKSIYDSIVTTYSDIIADIKYPLFTHLNSRKWTNRSRTINDGHPGPLTSYEYLLKLNFPLTNNSKEFAEKSENDMFEVSYRSDMITLFPYVKERDMYNKNVLF